MGWLELQIGRIMNIKGSYVALVTPFNERNEIDFPALEELIEWHIQEKTDGIVFLGTTGESATLSGEVLVTKSFPLRKFSIVFPRKKMDRRRWNLKIDSAHDPCALKE